MRTETHFSCWDKYERSPLLKEGESERVEADVVYAAGCTRLRKFLANILPRYWQELPCHGKILSREPGSQEKFYCKILFGQTKNLKGSQQKSTFLQIYVVRP